MSDTAGLQIRVEHATARTAAADLDRLRSSSRDTEAATNALREATQRFSVELNRAAKAAEASAAAQQRVEEELRRQQERTQNEAAARSATALDAQKRRELEIVRRSLLSQEEAIRESYLRQRKIIEESGAPKATQMGLLARLDARQASDIAGLRAREAAPAEAARKELAALVATQQAKATAKAAELAKEQAATRAALQTELEETRKTLLSEEQAIRASYARRRAIVRASVVSPQEQKRLLGQLGTAERKDLAEASPGAFRQLGGYAAVAAPLVATGAAVAGLSEVVHVTREFEKLTAGLITSTGSALNATRAFEALQDKAKETPFTLQEVTSAFTRLVNKGLEPSERAINSYGNTASSQGKSINDFVEAVADSIQGENERLKEFGVSAQVQGDKVTYSFRGVRTTVARESKAIQEYFIKLGETNFGDAMANRMQTLDGKLSNLGDAWNQLFYQIGQSSVGGLIKDTVDTAIEALTALTVFVQSEKMANASNAVQKFFTDIAGGAHKFAGFVQWITTGKTDIAEAARYTQKAMQEELDTQLLAARQAAREAESRRRLNKELKDAEKNYASLTEQQKKGLVSKDVLASATDAIVRLRSTTDEAVETQQKIEDTTQQLAAMKSKAAANIDALVAKGANRKSAAAEIKKQITDSEAGLKMLEAQYDRLLNTPQGDRLGGYGKAGTDKPQSKEAAAAEKKRKAEFKQLQDKLRDEEGLIEESFNNRQALIDRYANMKNGEWFRMSAVNLDTRNEDLLKTTSARVEAERKKALEDMKKSVRSQGEVLRDSYKENMKILQESGATEDEKAILARRILAKYDAEVVALDKAEKDKLQALKDGFLTEMELFKQQQEEKRQAILANEMATADEKEKLLLQLRKQTDKRMAEEDAARNQAILSSASDMFGGLAQTSKNMGGQNSATYRALFNASKAFSIAEASLGIATGTAKALELGWPAGIVAGLQVAAQGAALLAQITNTNYSGAYDGGGSIPAGSFGIVGERRPEIVWGPATVTGGADTARLFSQQQQPRYRDSMPTKIVIAPDMNTAAKHLATTEGERVVLGIAQKHATTLQTILGGR